MVKTAHHIALVCITCFSTFCAPAFAEIRALVIGVSDYAYIDADLRGPANDVKLVFDTLIARGANPKNIQVLAAKEVNLSNGIKVRSAPTRQAILDGFANLANQAQSEDTVFIFYSGHGSQAPDLNGDEAGGFDEILLASDTKGWNGNSGLVEGAILDDELAPLIQNILNKNAKVIAILDACHSATGFRDLPQAAFASRYVEPLALGVPQDFSPASDARISTPSLAGDFVFLYSAQSDERAFESPLGDAENDANWYGDFTQSLMTTLALPYDQTWKQALSTAIDGLHKNGSARQTPDAEGPLLNSNIFGEANGSNNIRLSNYTLNAGALHGVTLGAEIEIYSSDNAEQAVAVTKVIKLDALSAGLDRNIELPQTGIARILRAGPMKPVSVSIVGADEHWDTKIKEITSIMDGIQFVDQGGEISLYPNDAGLAVVYGAAGLENSETQNTFRITDSETLQQTLSNIVKLHRLGLALNQGDADAGFSFAMPGSEMVYTLSQVQAQGECDTQNDPAPISEPARVKHCDQLWIELKNETSSAQDVTVLYINRDYSISAIWPTNGLSNRVGMNETQEIGMQIDNPDSAAGFEEVLILSVPAQTGALRTDFSSLASDQTSRASASSEALNWLDSALDPSANSRNVGSTNPKIKSKRFRVRLNSKR